MMTSKMGLHLQVIFDISFLILFCWPALSLFLGFVFFYKSLLILEALISIFHSGFSSVSWKKYQELALTKKEVKSWNFQLDTMPVRRGSYQRWILLQQSIIPRSYKVMILPWLWGRIASPGSQESGLTLKGSWQLPRYRKLIMYLATFGPRTFSWTARWQMLVESSWEGQVSCGSILNQLHMAKL